MKKFFVYCPGQGQVYAWNFYGKNAAEARAACRDWLKVSRLPRGTQVWEA